MNTNKNRENKVVKMWESSLHTKLKVTFKNNTSIWWVIYKKNTQYEIERSFFNVVKNFIY